LQGERNTGCKTTDRSPGFRRTYLYFGCPALSKKTTEVIIASNNHYLIGVKKNQPTLYAQIEAVFADPRRHCGSYGCHERNKGRYEIRRIVFSYDIEGISEEWTGLRHIVAVYRRVREKGKTSEETAYFISSRADGNASLYAYGTRTHWAIENGLHYVKDVTLKEDSSKIKTGNAPQNISTLKNMGLNIFRSNNYTNIASAIRLVSNNINKLCELII
jgi:predicted transposase YbfD/YdcC